MLTGLGVLRSFWQRLWNPVAQAHRVETTSNMRVQVGSVPRDDRHDHSLQELATSHPLVVIPTAMKVGSVQFALRERGHQPLKDQRMANMHTQRDLSLSTVASEMTFTDKETYEISLFEFGQRRGFHGKHDGETVARRGRSSAMAK